VNIGWTKKRRNADKNSVVAYNAGAKRNADGAISGVVEVGLTIAIGVLAGGKPL
jgi:hypothetical protein